MERNRHIDLKAILRYAKPVTTGEKMFTAGIIGNVIAIIAITLLNQLANNNTIDHDQARIIKNLFFLGHLFSSYALMGPAMYKMKYFEKKNWLIKGKTHHLYEEKGESLKINTEDDSKKD